VREERNSSDTCFCPVVLLFRGAVVGADRPHFWVIPKCFKVLTLSSPEKSESMIAGVRVISIPKQPLF